MAEDGDEAGLFGDSSQDDASRGAATSVDPVAAAVAMDAARHDPQLSRKAGAYLDAQKELTRRQIEGFDDEHHLALAAARRRRYADHIRNGLLTVVALVVAGALAFFAFMVVDATSDHGLVIESFSVPPEIAATGLTGGVAASRFLDKLNAMQQATESERPADSYEYNWGSQIKVEIPETGISLGELQDLLRERLGHVTHISGEVLRTPSGISITARWGSAPPQTFAGKLDDFDNLAQKSAEAVYRVSQPFRFAEYLQQHGHVDEAAQAFTDLAAHGPESEKPWALSQLGIDEFNAHGATPSARANLEKAATLGSIPGIVGLIDMALWSGNDEKALAYSVLIDRKAQVRQSDTTEQFFEDNRRISEGYLAGQIGDFAKSAVDLKPLGGITGAAATANALAFDHDPAAAHAELAANATTNDIAFLQVDADSGWLNVPVYWIASAQGDWRSALADMQACDGWLKTRAPQHAVYGLMRDVFIVPLEALALAESGNLARAEALIATTRADCYLCARVRGRIAAMKGDRAAASNAFAEAVRLGPSLPFAYTDWGAMLMSKGDFDGAIAKFTEANQKGPHFADPLEMWGEALMQKNRSDLALAKFEEANKYAPNWGRLHLEWGKALVYAGHKDDARKQFTAASTLDLSPSDRDDVMKRRGKK
jgi:tetratricopeptide (TPR) repeat protein